MRISELHTLTPVQIGYLLVLISELGPTIPVAANELYWPLGFEQKKTNAYRIRIRVGKSHV